MTAKVTTKLTTPETTQSAAPVVPVIGDSLGALSSGFSRIAGVRTLVEGLRRGDARSFEVSGLTGSARAFLLETLSQELSRPLLYLSSSSEDAFALVQDLERLSLSSGVYHFPSLSIKPYSFTLPAGETLGRRISSLSALASGQARVVVAPLAAVMEPTLSPACLQSETISLEVNSEVPLETVVDALIRLGFRRVSNVEEVGDFSVRGGLVDFFSPGAARPVRVEYFGDTVETIRTFEVSDQRTRGNLSSVSLLPRREAPYDLSKVEEFLDSVGDKEEEIIRSRFLNDPDLPGLEWLAPLFHSARSSLSEHLPESVIVVTDGRERLMLEAEKLCRDDESRRTQAQASLPSLSNVEGFLRPPEVLFNQKSSITKIDALPFRGAGKNVISIGCKEPPPIGGKMDELASVLHSYRVAGITYVIGADNPGQAERIRELIHDNLPGEDPPVIVGMFQGGFFSPGGKVALLTDHQIFARNYRRRRRKRFKEGMALTSYTNLESGNFVVHTDHGLARYLRLETILLDNRHRDCLLLEYANEDRLFVPIEEFNRVSKYAGKDAAPRLSQLGGIAWEKLKSRAKKSVEDLAESLVRLYAERLARPGHAFAPDTSWMRRLEASFPYEETEDQQKAIDAVKADMERPSPADRLVCGDVGFGKTEVAVRAALKCVEEGRQVALLVPTTILAQQHYNTFCDRLKEFPVMVEMMSRFRTGKQLAVIEKKLKQGSIDILIGTHRILSKKVVFRDLGLLVIDEEQRFGVKSKERLRQMKANVDTIAMTATPIPRTLQMSLSGARDMSLIASSPRGRLPITTVVSEFTPDIIGEAILREIDRGGQVFFVHNRVRTISAVKDYLEKLLPQISLLVGHGQMPERQLENVMLQFVQGKAQLLLCTSIIESGLDIPNVNTILIDRSDRFGMAQLYQLRGRVGRSSEQAYCYLLTPGYRRMTEDARKRLKAIESHTELGSGFALAMRDLELRGAGNMLGAKQSGFIDEIGFDMYSKLLEEAVAEFKGEGTRGLPATTLETDLEVYLPEDYIDINQHKVDVYRRLAQARSVSQVELIREELADRYGRPPQAALNLIEATALKLAAAQLRIDKVRMKSGRVELHYESGKEFDRPEIERMRQAVECHLEFVLSPNAIVTIDVGALKEEERLVYVRRALECTVEG